MPIDSQKSCVQLGDGNYENPILNMNCKYDRSGSGCDVTSTESYSGFPEVISYFCSVLAPLNPGRERQNDIARDIHERPCGADDFAEGATRQSAPLGPLPVCPLSLEQGRRSPDGHPGSRCGYRNSGIGIIEGSVMRPIRGGCLR